MIIVSQDKMEILNFDKIFRLYVDNWSNEEFATEPNCFCIRAEKSSDNMICAFLGEYKTEEREKEVLQDISSRYEAIELCKREHHMSEFFGYTLADYTPIYEMPKE